MIENTADISIRAFGDSLAELFTNSSRGMMAYLFGEEVFSLPEKKESQIHLHARNRESLLVKWLSDLLYISCTERAVTLHQNFESISDTELHARISTAPARAEKEIKAVTYYDLKVELKNSLWQATVTYDI